MLFIEGFVATDFQFLTRNDGQKIMDQVVNVTKGGEKCTTFKACKALLDDGKDIDYDGASGSVDLSDVGEPTVGVYDVWSYDDQGKPNNIAGVAQIKITG